MVSNKGSGPIYIHEYIYEYIYEYMSQVPTGDSMEHYPMGKDLLTLTI
jgi:hypothetical protein